MLEAICEMAPKLRDAGIYHVELDAVTFTVSPTDPTDKSRAELMNPHTDSDPLNDPATFGGRRMPRFERLYNPVDDN